jgi:hypothetical protein
MTHSQNTVRVRIAAITVAALTLVLASAPLAQARGLPDCSYSGTTPCFEKVWVDGDQVKMTFINLNPPPTNAPMVNFYVLAPQTGTPQGAGPFSPFLHDHVTSDSRPQEERHGENHGDLNVQDENHGDLNVHYHGFFVFCSAQGISSGACVPTMTSIGGGIVPLAKTVNGHSLTSVDRIESAANSGLVILIDTGGVFIARLNLGD